MMKQATQRTMRYVSVGPKPDYSFKIQNTTIPTIEDPEKEILLKIKASALNRADVLQRRGLYNPPEGASEILGLEAVGVEVDPHTLEEKTSEGLLGVLLSGGGYAQYTKLDRRHVIRIPDSMNLEQAAAIPEVWLTAFLLVKLSQIQEGQWAYIAAGASGVGTALSQILTKYVKAQAIVTCSSQEKVDFCSQFGVSGGLVIDRSNPDEIRQRLQVMTGISNGFDAAFDCVGAGQNNLISEILNMDSKWVLYGLLSGFKTEESNLLRHILKKRISLIGTTLRSRDDEFKADLIQEFNQELLPLFQAGELVPVIDTVETITLSADGDDNLEVEAQKIESLFERMRTNQNKSKIVMLFE